jgi:hypothetical protein
MLQFVEQFTFVYCGDCEAVMSIMFQMSDCEFHTTDMVNFTMGILIKMRRRM